MKDKSLFNFGLKDTKIYFDGKMNVIINNEPGFDFSIKEIRKIDFNNEENIINTLETNTISSAPSVTIKNRILHIAGIDFETVIYPVVIYNTNGLKVMSIAEEASMGINIERLIKGIYLIKINNNTVKFIN